MACTDWIERQPGDKRPTLPRSATVEVEHRNGFTHRAVVACVDWRHLKIPGDVVRYRIAPSEVKPQGEI